MIKHHIKHSCFCRDRSPNGPPLSLPHMLWKILLKHGIRRHSRFEIKIRIRYKDLYKIYEFYPFLMGLDDLWSELCLRGYKRHLSFKNLVRECIYRSIC